MEGPYHREGAPERYDLTTDYKGNKGEKLLVSGKVYSHDCMSPVANATINLWQADPAGSYDMKSNQFLFRAIVKTNKHGEYGFLTFLPGYYVDPAVGARPRHIHFKIAAPGHKLLVTQLYFEGDPKLSDDYFVKRNDGMSRALPYPKTADGKYHVKFDIFLQPL